MSRFSSLLCSLLFCMITYAQEITVTGKSPQEAKKCLVSQ